MSAVSGGRGSRALPGSRVLPGSRGWAGGLVLLALLVVAGAAVRRNRADGGIVQTLVLPSPPGAIAVDTRTGRAFVPLTGGEGHVAVLDTRSGRLLRLVGPFPVNVFNVSVAVDETTRRVFLDGGDGLVAVLDARDGQAIATTPAGGAPSVMVLDERHGRVVITNPNGDSVDVLDARSGLLIRTVYLGLDAAPRGIAVDTRSGHVFVANGGTQTVSILDPAAGTVRRAQGAAPYPQVAVDARAGHALVGTAGGVVVLDARTGRVLSSVPIRFAPGTVLQPDVDEQAGRAFAEDGRRVYVLDTRSGRVVRTLTMSWATITVDERLGRVFIVDGLHGTLSVVDARSGTIIGTIAIGANPSVPAVDERTGRLYIVSEGMTDAQGNPTGGGTIAVVDARRGVLVRTIPAGVGPVGMALDGRAGRALVVDTGGTVEYPDPWAWLPSWLRRRLPFLPAAGSRRHHVPGSISVLVITR